jgi:hypothetical protein
VRLSRAVRKAWGSPKVQPAYLTLLPGRRTRAGGRRNRALSRPPRGVARPRVTLIRLRTMSGHARFAPDPRASPTCPRSRSGAARSGSFVGLASLSRRAAWEETDIAGDFVKRVVKETEIELTTSSATPRGAPHPHHQSNGGAPDRQILYSASHFSQSGRGSGRRRHVAKWLTHMSQGS